MEAMDMENSHNPGGGSSETSEKRFDVTLSFKVSYARYDFVDHLYRSLHQSGIRVVWDEDLAMGGRCTEQSITHYIRHSKIAIPILSEDYPSSRWCLRELAQMVECHNTNGQIIMPVFLDVTPSVVRDRSHSYGEAIAEHRQRGVDANTLREWEEALIHGGSIPGLESDSLGTQTSIINALVANVSRVLNGYFTGIEHRVERFSARNRLSVIQPPDSISRVIEAESSSEVGYKVEYSKPSNTEHSSFQGVKRKFEGNEGRIDNIRSNDDELGTKYRKVGKISVSRTEIAKGSNGTIVYEGKYEDRLVAVKQLVRAHLAIATNEIKKLIASDEHENIVRYFGQEHNEDFVYLALERCDCSLDDLIQVHSNSSNDSVSDNSASVDDYKIERVRRMMEGDDLWTKDGYPSPCLVKLMRDVVSGLNHLHYIKIIHQDLKPQNVLIAKNRLLGAKLSDMGISTCLPKDRSSMGYRVIGCGTSGWRAPEQLKGGRQTSAIDLFSFGCVLFFCITRGRHPFGEDRHRDSNIEKNEMDLSLVKFIPEAYDLLSGLLNEDPNLRPKASEVLHHPFFWNSEERLSFLREVSDKVELKHNSNLLKELEKTAKLVFGKNWDKKIGTKVMADLREHRRKPYDGSSVRDLLRAVRNKFSHHMEAPKEIKEIHGSDADGLDIYFSRRFPRLLMESYRVLSRICEGEKCLQKYLLLTPWPLPTEIPSSSQQVGHEVVIH